MSRMLRVIIIITCATLGMSLLRPMGVRAEYRVALDYVYIYELNASNNQIVDQGSVKVSSVDNMSGGVTIGNVMDTAGYMIVFLQFADDMPDYYYANIRASVTNNPGSNAGLQFVNNSGRQIGGSGVDGGPIKAATCFWTRYSSTGDQSTLPYDSPGSNTSVNAKFFVDNSANYDNYCQFCFYVNKAGADLKITIDGVYIESLKEDVVDAIEQGTMDIVDAIGDGFGASSEDQAAADQFLADSEEQSAELDNLTSQMGAVNKPDTGDISGDVSDYVDQDGVQAYTGVLGAITANPTVLAMLTILFTIAFAGYVLFGKR